MNPDNLAHNIPEGLEETDKYFGKKLWDWVFITAPPASIALTAYLALQPTGVKAVALVAGTLAAIGIVSLIHPNHLTVREWFGNILHHKRRQTTVEHMSEADPESPQTHSPDKQPWEVLDRTQDNTYVERIHPDLDVVERIDGTFVGAIEITGKNMALASNGEWERQKQNLGQFFNRACDFPTQIYVTSTSFPIEEHIETFQDRQTDEDVRTNPIKAQLLQSYTHKVLADTSQQGLNQRKYYMFVTANEQDLLDSGASDPGIAESLSSIPVLGDIVTDIIGARDLTAEEKKREKAKIVQERLNKIKSQGVNPLDGCGTRKVGADRLAVLLREHWTNREAQYDFPSENLIRTSGFVTNE